MRLDLLRYRRRHRELRRTGWVGERSERSLRGCKVGMLLVVAVESGTARYARRRSRRLVEAGNMRLLDTQTVVELDSRHFVVVVGNLTVVQECMGQVMGRSGHRSTLLRAL